MSDTLAEEGKRTDRQKSPVEERAAKQTDAVESVQFDRAEFGRLQSNVQRLIEMLLIIDHLIFIVLLFKAHRKIL